MKNKVFSYLSNGFLIIGTAIGIYVLADIFLLGRNLPAGACPITDNRPWLILAVIFLILSLALSFFEKKSPTGQ
jgi:hypothetical protein